MLHRQRAATPESIGRVIGKAIPGVAVLQIRSSRVWLLEDGEPFAEIDLVDGGEQLHVRFSAHCAPHWAGVTACALHKAGARGVGVHTDVFLQTADGLVHYGDTATMHFKYLQKTGQLRSASVSSLVMV